MSQIYYDRSGIIIFLTTLSFSTLFLSTFSSSTMGQISDTLTDSQPNVILLSISNMSITDSATGLTSVTGTVLNNSTESVENMKVGVTLYDSDNKTIRETSRFVSGPFTVYEPNSTERFNFLMSVEEFDNYKASAYAERVP